MKIKWQYKPFQNIFHEIADLLYLLENDIQRACSIAKALLGANVRLLEAFTNSIANTFEISNDLKNQIYRLSGIEKFELLLQFRNKKLDRGNSLTAAIKTIKNKRNRLTHPIDEIQDFKSLQAYNSAIKFETTSNPYKIDKKEIKSILTNTLLFLNKYILEWADFNPEELSKILFDSLVCENKPPRPMQLSALEKDKEYIEKTLKIRIDFIKTFKAGLIPSYQMLVLNT